MGNIEKCFKFVNFGELSKASSICAQSNAKLPLPKNIQENSDLVYALRSLGVGVRAALDAQDLDRKEV